MGGRMHPSFLVATALAAALVTPVGMADDRPVLRIAVQSDPTRDVLDPHREMSNVGQRFFHNLFDSLLTIDYFDNWRLRPALAESWERIDGRTVEFTLREGVRFHDGSILTAADVAFTLEPTRLLDESWPGAGIMQRFWGGIDRVEVVDERTVRFVAKDIDPLLEYRLSASGSQIISQAAFEAAPDIDSWSRAPVATGPFRVASYRPDASVVYAAFDDYWGGRPTVREVHWTVVPEVAGRVAGLVAGDYDIATNIPPDLIDQVEAYDHLEIRGGPIGNHHILVFDTRHPQLQDVRMREALSLAIDRELIVDALWGGRTAIPNGYQFEAFGELYFADHPQPAYDPARAKALVAAAGYDGTAIPFNIVNDYYTTEVARAEVLVDMWRQIGVNVEISIHDDFSDLNGGLRNGSTTILYPDPVGSIVRTWGQGSYWDEQGVMTNLPERTAFFAVGDALGATLDPAERRRLAGEVLDFMEIHKPLVVLHQNAMFYGVRETIDWRPVDSPVMELRPFNLAVR